MMQAGPILLSFPPVLWPFFAALAAFALFLIARRPARKRLGLRLTAGAIAILALFALAAQPRWQRMQKSAEAILLTPGALDSLPRAAVVFSLPGAGAVSGSSAKIQHIPDAGYLQRHFPEISLYQVLGHGLRDYDWAALDSIAIIPRLAQPAPGIQFLSWQRELYWGEKARIQGSVAGLQNQAGTLYLFDPGGVADSLPVSAGNSRFDLRALPRAPGRFLYTLLLRSSQGDTLAQEIIDFVVRAPRPLQVLILEARPRFETKYFKNWMSKNRHALGMRTLLSRERDREEFVNLAKTNLRQVSLPLLQKFDLLLIDGETLQRMNARERRALHTAVREGLGVLLLADEMPWRKQKTPADEFFRRFDFEPFVGMDERLVRPVWPDLDTLKVTAVPAESFVIKEAPELKPLVQDEMERWLAAAQVTGLGQVGLTLIRNTYRWQLEGRTDLYAAYWSYLISALARREDQNGRWNLRMGRPILVDQPLSLTLTGAFGKVAALITTREQKADSIFLAPEVNEPGRAHGIFWPRQAGWHALATPGGSQAWFYVGERARWQTWQQAQKIAATRIQAERCRQNSTTRETGRFHQAEPIAPFLFFAIFLLSAGYLWLERKL